jgi:fructokinase
MLIGVDWGGTKIEVVALEPNGTELLRIRRDTPRGDYEGCLRTVLELIDEAEATTGKTGSIGIGIPGSLEPISRLGKGGSSTWINGQPVEADLQRVINRPIRVVNDADCFAASEAVDGAGVGYTVVFGVIMASGTGAGIAINGRAHHGPNNSAGDWGHSDPLAVPKAAAVMRARGHAADAVRRITLDNPRTFLGQSANFSDAPLRPTAADLGR